MANTCFTEIRVVGEKDSLLSLVNVIERVAQDTLDRCYNFEEMANALGLKVEEGTDMRGKWWNARIDLSSEPAVLSFLEEHAWKPGTLLHTLLHDTSLGKSISAVYTRSSDWDASIHTCDDSEGLFFPEPLAYYCKGDKYIGFCKSEEDALKWCRENYSDESFELSDFEFVTIENTSMYV